MDENWRENERIGEWSRHWRTPTNVLRYWLDLWSLCSCVRHYSISILSIDAVGSDRGSAADSGKRTIHVSIAFRAVQWRKDVRLFRDHSLNCQRWATANGRNHSLRTPSKRLRTGNSWFSSLLNRWMPSNDLEMFSIHSLPRLALSLFARRKSPPHNTIVPRTVSHCHRLSLTPFARAHLFAIILEMLFFDSFNWNILGRRARWHISLDNSIKYCTFPLK